MPDGLSATLAEIRDRNIDTYADGSTSDIPRLVAALEAVLKLADKPSTGIPPVRIRAAITAALTGKEAGDG